MKKMMSPFMAFVLLISLSGISQVKVKNSLITPADKKEEDRREKERKEIRKAQEKKVAKEWKKVSKFEKESSPWATWYRKMFLPGLLKLSSIRKELYKHNLYDTYVERPKTEEDCVGKTSYRVSEGYCNDIEDPTMGAVWTRFGRNTDPMIDNQKNYDVLYPNPRTISKELLERKKFLPVDFLNLMAVSWIQYMTHDWFSHGDNEDPSKVKPFFLPLDKSDKLGETLVFPKSMIDSSKTKRENIRFPYVFKNEVTHWWDGSQVYGSSTAKTNSLRSFKGGKLTVDNNGNIPLGGDGVEKTGFNRNWWVGLSLLHNLFVKEHNAVADALSEKYPSMKDEELFQKARLVVAALMAKIHTVEWTPAILTSKKLEHGMKANWNGLINNSGKVSKPWEKILKSEVTSGIVGGKKNLADVPFSMTEEFVSVYRMHPLLPDNLVLKKMSDKSYAKAITLNQTREAKSGNLLKNNKMDDLFYSFGQMHPGQLTLNNYPKELMNMSIPFVGKMDLAAMDILRDRERNVPRYNEFRRQFRLKPLTSFEQLTSDKAQLAKLKKIYDNDIEALDLLVGCLAEQYRPTGFGFGETAFQVFVVMASRRLVADRFYTTDYNKETYTKLGLDWIDNNNMKTILLRHHPRLQKTLFGVKNAFNPWNKL